ncbi:Mitogen-activated protein kinase kinase kinase [Abeliophyllum distichum]|uniref:Mitogen-activated protein kinase kinase kinase n=1 Tax=Abeliophyllum distichum TaxID=126358 RepID=A0ABD1U284_9LAMI
MLMQARFLHLSSYKTRSLDVLPLSDRTSFRVEGVDGEFDRICRSLGLSGPEDFSIPVAAWEARRALSPSGNLKTPGFNDRSVLDELSERFGAGVKVGDAVVDDTELKDRVYLNLDKSEATVNNVSENEVESKLFSSGGWGIKGIRPPKLAPPPAIMRSVVDNTSSTWDIFRSFGPQDDRDLNSPRDVVDSLVDAFEENKEVNRREIVGKQEESGEGGKNATGVGLESCSDSTTDENDDGSVS